MDANTALDMVTTALANGDLTLTDAKALMNDLPPELTGDEISDLIDAGELDTDEDDDTMTAADMAAELGVNPRSLRRQLRNAGVGCGQGSFYLIKRADLPALRSRLGIA